MINHTLDVKDLGFYHLSWHGTCFFLFWNYLTRPGKTGCLSLPPYTRELAYLPLWAVAPGRQLLYPDNQKHVLPQKCCYCYLCPLTVDPWPREIQRDSKTVQSTLPTAVTKDKVQIVSRDDVKIGTIAALFVIPSGMLRPWSVSLFKVGAAWWDGASTLETSSALYMTNWFSQWLLDCSDSHGTIICHHQRLWWNRPYIWWHSQHLKHFVAWNILCSMV